MSEFFGPMRATTRGVTSRLVAATVRVMGRNARPVSSASSPRMRWRLSAPKKNIE